MSPTPPSSPTPPPPPPSDFQDRVSKRDTLLTALPFQCGLTYRESENFMFGSGSQPFVVAVRRVDVDVCPRRNISSPFCTTSSLHPTTNGGVQKWKLGRNMYALRTRFFCTFWRRFACSVGEY